METDLSKGASKQGDELPPERLADVEERKLRLQRLQIWVQAGAGIIPLLAVIFTILYGSWSLNRQADQQFELEIAKAVFQAPSHAEAVGRARFYRRLFPDHISRDLAAHENIEQYETEARMEFVKIVSERGLTPAETAELWTRVFSDHFARDPQIAALLARSRSPREGSRGRAARRAR